MLRWHGEGSGVCLCCVNGRGSRRKRGERALGAEFHDEWEDGETCTDRRLLILCIS